MDWFWHLEQLQLNYYNNNLVNAFLGSEHFEPRHWELENAEPGPNTCIRRTNPRTGSSTDQTVIKSAFRNTFRSKGW